MGNRNLDYTLADAGILAVDAIGKASRSRANELNEMRRQLLEKYYKELEDKQKQSAWYPGYSALTNLAVGVISAGVGSYSKETAEALSGVGRAASSGFDSMSRFKDAEVTRAKSVTDLKASEAGTVEDAKRKADEIAGHIANAILKAQELVK
ncbi:MAG: hypothetical protein JXA94_05030 [Parachlamydiales bacterium]|nr:hypothetical protein [Parachlamydiales bacterium]